MASALPPTVLDDIMYRLEENRYDKRPKLYEQLVDKWANRINRILSNVVIMKKDEDMIVLFYMAKNGHAPLVKRISSWAERNGHVALLEVCALRLGYSSILELFYLNVTEKETVWVGTDLEDEQVWIHLLRDVYENLKSNQKRLRIHEVALMKNYKCLFFGEIILFLQQYKGIIEYDYDRYAVPIVVFDKHTFVLEILGDLTSNTSDLFDRLSSTYFRPPHKNLGRRALMNELVDMLFSVVRWHLRDMVRFFYLLEDPLPFILEKGDMVLKILEGLSDVNIQPKPWDLTGQSKSDLHLFHDQNVFKKMVVLVSDKNEALGQLMKKMASMTSSCLPEYNPLLF